MIENDVNFALVLTVGTEDDGYITGTGGRRFLDAYRKRPEDFKRRILERVIGTVADLRAVEQRRLDMIKPEELGVRYYNRTRLAAGWPNDVIQARYKVEKAEGRGRKWWQRPDGTRYMASVSKNNEDIPGHGRAVPKALGKSVSGTRWWYSPLTGERYRSILPKNEIDLLGHIAIKGNKSSVGRIRSKASRETQRKSIAARIESGLSFGRPKGSKNNRIRKGIPCSPAAIAKLKETFKRRRQLGLPIGRPKGIPWRPPSTSV